MSVNTYISRRTHIIQAQKKNKINIVVKKFGQVFGEHVE